MRWLGACRGGAAPGVPTHQAQRRRCMLAARYARRRAATAEKRAERAAQEERAYRNRRAMALERKETRRD